MVLLVLAGSLATLALASPPTKPKCTHAQGRLFNALPNEDHGRMIGTIAGDYFIDTVFPFNSHDPDDSDVLFIWLDSHVEGTRGAVFFREYSAVDLGEQLNTNGAVLSTIVRGTGQWENATGHIALSGFFHTDEGTGEWDYQGEICTP
jgi:hypothetical protein